MSKKAEVIGVVIEDGLINVQQASVPEIFKTEESILQIVNLIKSEVSEFVPDLETIKGRKEIASMSSKVSKSKVRLDDLGKELVSGMKEQCKVIDSARKVARDELDRLRDSVRQPLTDWEKEQERLAAEEQLRIEVEAAHIEALELDELYTLRKEKEEAERAERERAEKERLEREQKEREERIIQQERERAEREAEEKLRAEKEESERKIREAQQESERKIREAQEQADRKIREEQERQAREESARKERERNELEAKEKERLEQERLAARKSHQTKVNNAAMNAIILVLAGSHSLNQTESKSLAKDIVTSIAKGRVDHVTINY